MSEFSESYHVRTSDPKATVGKIREAGLAGLYFESDSGWLTFVPYGASDMGGSPMGAADALVHATEMPVLWYLYAEDHTWSFRLFQMGAPALAFSAWWDEDTGSDRSRLDLDVLCRNLPDTVDRTALDRLLALPPEDSSEFRQAAYRFAELLGLPSYQWLSPAYVQLEPEVFLESGAKKLGPCPPPLGDQIPHPPSCNIRLERPDISAKEAFEIAERHMKDWRPDWLHLLLCSCAQLLGPDGRLQPGIYWDVTYIERQGSGTISLGVWPDARIIVHAGPGSPLADPSRLPPLPDSWIDSPELAAIVCAFPIPEDCKPFGLHMALEVLNRGGRWCWCVRCMETDYQRRWVDFLVEPQTGEIMSARYQRQEGQEIVEERELA